MKQNIIAVIQARTSSTRLPGKVFLPLAGEPLLLRMYERVVRSKSIDEIVIATSLNPSDDSIEEFCRANKIKFFRGDENDLLDRHYKTALEYNATHVVKIPSDCPLIDPAVIDRVVNLYLDNQNSFDYVSNLHPATYPDGNDVEIMPVEILEVAWKEATKDFEREHTTPFIWENPERFRIGNDVWETGLNFSMSHRFTIDYEEDYKFIVKVYDELYNTNKNFSLCDIMLLLDRKPEIKKINEKYAGVNWYRKNLHELKTILPTETKKI